MLTVENESDDYYHHGDKVIWNENDFENGSRTWNGMQNGTVKPIWSDYANGTVTQTWISI